MQRHILAGLLLCGEEERDTRDDSQAAEAWSLIASNCTFRWSSGSFERTKLHGHRDGDFRRDPALDIDLSHGAGL